MPKKIDTAGLKHFKDKENAMVASEFSASKSYAIGEYVYYKGTLYKFKAAHAAGAWTNADVDAVKLADDVSVLKESITSFNGISLGTNLIGSLGNTLYPLEVPTNTVLTMSTADGSTLGVSSLNLQFYDENRKRLSDGWNFNSSSSKRTITYTEEKASFVAWSKTPGKILQLNFGNEVLPYEEYVFPVWYSLENKDTKNAGYWRHDLSIPANSLHNAFAEINVDIQSGSKFAIIETVNYDFNRQVYIYYDDGSNERVFNYNTASGYSRRCVIVSAKNKNIVGVGAYINNTSENDLSYTIEVMAEKSLSYYTGIPSQTSYYIDEGDGNYIYFKIGKSRSLVQSIAVVNNEVWEFAQGKAYYNGVEYTLENGHGNNCNWGKELHGSYPYLYCPTWNQNEMNINVFSFDGTAFSLVRTIHFNGFTGYLNAYVNEEDGFIYGFILSDNTEGSCKFIISDLNGTVITEENLPYKIRTPQGMCMHSGVIYLVSGYGNTASPNYLYKISPNGSLIGKYRMGQIGNLGEIEGIDFINDEMILATYYNFYINPIKAPNMNRYEYIKQLE